MVAVICGAFQAQGFRPRLKQAVVEKQWGTFPVAAYGQRTIGGSDDRMDSTLPPVFNPKIVPLS